MIDTYIKMNQWVLQNIRKTQQEYFECLEDGGVSPESSLKDVHFKHSFARDEFWQKKEEETSGNQSDVYIGSK